MRASLALSHAWARFRAWAAASRFLTFSLLIHTICVLLLGGTILYQVVDQAPDFESGAEGLLTDASATEAPPSDAFDDAVVQQFSEQVPPPLAAPLEAIVTESQAVTWTVVAVSSARIHGISDSLRGASSSAGNSLSAGGSMGSGGMGGGIAGIRTAMIFGKKVMARKLGVILDVSGSAHRYLAGAVTEIQRGFVDATLILYPGCGLMEFKGKSGHNIRKYSTITNRDLEKNNDGFTTSSQLTSALEIPAFEEMTKRPSVKNTLFVSWFDDKDDDHEMLTCRTQVAFDDLVKRGVDTIYWFADFQDPIDPSVVKELRAQLAKRRIVLHVHNFAGEKIPTLVTEIAEKSGGTVNIERPQ